MYAFMIGGNSALWIRMKSDDLHSLALSAGGTYQGKDWLWAYGGEDGASGTLGKKLRQYDIASNKWTDLDNGTKPNNPGILYRGSAAFAGSCIYILGGRAGKLNTDAASSEYWRQNTEGESG